MTRAPLLVPVLCFAAALLAGCEALRGATYRFEVVDAESGQPAPGAHLRLFWFDDPGDVLGQGPVEERVRDVGRDRRLLDSNGLSQVDWADAEADAAGTVRLNGDTDFGGGRGLLLGELGTGEESPVGLWVRVLRRDAPGAAERDFVIVGGLEGPHLVRVRTAGGLPRKGEEAGAVERLAGEGGSERGWRVVIPVER